MLNLLPQAGWPLPRLRMLESSHCLSETAENSLASVDQGEEDEGCGIHRVS